MNTLCGQHVEVLTFKSGGKYDNQQALKVTFHIYYVTFVMLSQTIVLLLLLLLLLAFTTH